MNTLRNQVQLIGNLGKDLEFKTFESGSQMVSGTIATNEYYKNNKGEKVQETQWHNITAWGKTAELMNDLLKKGDEVAVQGKLAHRSYDDSSGVKRYISEVVIGSFLKISRSQDQDQDQDQTKG